MFASALFCDGTVSLLLRVAINTSGSNVSTGLAFTPGLQVTPMADGASMLGMLSHLPCCLSCVSHATHVLRCTSPLCRGAKNSWQVSCCAKEAAQRGVTWELRHGGHSSACGRYSPRSSQNAQPSSAMRAAEHVFCIPTHDCHTSGSLLSWLTKHANLAGDAGKDADTPQIVSCNTDASAQLTCHQHEAQGEDISNGEALHHLAPNACVRFNATIMC